MTPVDPGRMELVSSVANSPTFARASVLRKLLLYLAEHPEEGLSEYSIALDVLGKREDFDPRIDATVRVQISRLRQKLKEYYEKDGRDAAKRLVIRPGSHRIELEDAPEGSSPRTPVPWGRIFGVAATVALVLLALNNFTLRTQLNGLSEQRTLPPLWQAMLNPGRLTRIIYPIPVFYHWDRLRVRDVDVRDPEGWKTSPRLAEFVEKFGLPQLSQSYSVSSDTAATIQLTRFLAERRTPLDVSPTGALSLDQYGNDNLIFLGIPPTNTALDPFLNLLNFHITGGGGVVGNRKPGRGEPVEWAPQRQNEAPQKRFGIIAVVPGQTAESRLALLMGLDTASLAAALTAPPSLEALTEIWRQNGHPPYFETVIEAELVDAKVRHARVKAFRTIAQTVDYKR
jgi:hypothetical protein